VNLLGCALIGSAYGIWSMHSQIFIMIAVFLGAFTTYSTFQVEALQLLFARRFKSFFFYLMSGYGGGLLLAVCAYQILLH
jgi:CrcB protein